MSDYCKMIDGKSFFNTILESALRKDLNLFYNLAQKKIIGV
jgi:hypothetical protein